jgi:S-formylglutathione hydrolase FrmB
VGGFSRVSLVDGWFPQAVVILAVGSVTVGMLSARTRVRRLAWLAVGVTGAMAVLAGLIAQFQVFDFTYPPSFYVWIGLAVFAAGLAPLGWRQSGWASRALSVSAVVLTVAMAATLINEHYAYFPTPAALFGQVAVDEVSVNHLMALTRTAAVRPGPSPVAADYKPPTADETDLTAATAVPVGRRSHGAVVTVDLPAHRSHFTHRPALVYLPPVWFSSPRPKLPVIMTLTGTPSLVSDWTRAAHADQIADDYAAAHHGWAPILVFPDPNGSNLGDTECVDSPQGNAETYLTEDVPADVVALFGSAPPQWAVAGLSEGGMCAALLTIRHPDVFSAFADFGGEPGPVVGHDKAATMRLLFGGSKQAWRDHDPLTLLGRRRFDGHAGWFEVGRDDRGPLAAAKRLSSAASEAGMTTDLVVRPGKHNFTFWSEAFRHSLPWLVERLTGAQSVPSAR